jgi:uncharacterized protein YqhQ
MRALIKFILITVLVVMLLRLLFRVFVPDLFKKLVRNILLDPKKSNINFENEKKHEGEISIKKNNNLNKSNKNDSYGEYIDYEEVKD